MASDRTVGFTTGVVIFRARFIREVSKRNVESASVDSVGREATVSLKPVKNNLCL